MTRRPLAAICVLALAACATTPDTEQTGVPRQTTTSYDLPVVAHDWTPTPPTTVAPVVPMTAAPPVTAEVEPEPEVVPLASSEPVAQTGGVWEHLARIRQCESGGNYGAVSSSGKFRGAYQFSRSTWDWVAEAAGRPDLVGVDPVAAAPGDQDAMAYWLYTNDGPQHWPECRYA